MATSAANNDSTENAPDGKKSKKKLILIIVAVLVVLLAGAGAGWFFLLRSHEPTNEEPEEVKKKEKANPAALPVFVALDPFTVNLQPSGQFLQISLTVQVETAADSEHLKAYLPQIRSRLLLMLSGKTAEEISTVEGKNQLTLEIMALLKLPLASGMEPLQVSNVFITSFVIQ